MNKEQMVLENIASAITVQQLGMPTEIADVSVSTSHYVRALLQNWRQGTVWSRGRSDVSFSNKKPWKQKGTGRARAGSPKSPLWRGGGVIFGPQERSRLLKINRKARW
jgi:ribosomal protein L4